MNDLKLCEREEEIAELLLRGFTARQIAEELHYTLETVKTYKKLLYRKLAVHDKRQLFERLNGDKKK